MVLGGRNTSKGATGAGKTTVLNLLAGRMTNGIMSGEVRPSGPTGPTVRHHRYPPGVSPASVLTCFPRSYLPG